MTEEIIKIMREAGAQLRAALPDAIRTEEKSCPEDVVTNYDRQVQRYLEEKLRALVPEAGFLGEEGLRSEGDGALRFIIDPIDGTMNFSRHMKRSCISVALADAEGVCFGAVYDPYLDEMFTAERGCGAYLNGAPIRVSQKRLGEGLFLVGSSSYYRALAEDTFRLARAFYDRCLDFRRSGTAAIDLCTIAAGRAEAFFECILSPWDYAAGSLIVTEAGGTVTTLTGEALSLTERSSLLACGEGCRAESEAAVREALR